MGLYKSPLELIEYRESEMLTTKLKKVNIDLSVKELKHIQTISLEEGVKKTIDWMRDYYRIDKK